MRSKKDRIAELEAELSGTRQLVFHMAKLVELGKLIAVVAHELSQPLLGIKAFAQILQRRYPDDEFIAPKVRIIVQQAKVMESILDNLRRYSAQHGTEPTAVDLRWVAEAAVELLQERARKTKVRIDLEVVECLPEVLGTAGHLQQIAVNLLSNALDELEPAEAGRVLIRLQARDDRVVMQVADTGHGVPEQIRPRLFEPFFTTKPEGLGTGLGLSICRDILQDYGGEIRLMEPGELADVGDDFGSAFEVTLRRALEKGGSGADGSVDG